MRQGIGEIEKKRFLPVPVNEPKCFFCHLCRGIILSPKPIEVRIRSCRGIDGLMHHDMSIVQTIPAIIFPKMGGIEIMCLFLIEVSVVIIESLF